MKKLLMIALVAGSFALLGADYAVAGSGCYCQAPCVAAQPAFPAPAVAQGPVVQGRRSYSVEAGVAPVYRAPMMRSYRAYGPSRPAMDAGRKIRGDY